MFISRVPLAYVVLSHERDARLKVGHIDKVIGLAAQCVGDQRARAVHRGENRDSLATPPQRSDQPGEAVMASNEHQMVNACRHLHRVNGHFETHIALWVPSSLGIEHQAHRLRRNGESVVVQPIE